MECSDILIEIDREKVEVSRASLNCLRIVP